MGCFGRENFFFVGVVRSVVWECGVVGGEVLRRIVEVRSYIFRFSVIVGGYWGLVMFGEIVRLFYCEFINFIFCFSCFDWEFVSYKRRNFD